MSFDAWVVGFGLSRVLIELKVTKPPWAYAVLAAAALTDAYLLYVFFKRWKRAELHEGLTGAGEEPRLTRAGSDRRRADRVVQVIALSTRNPAQIIGASSFFRGNRGGVS
jgi:hypothetical protein